MLSESVPTTNLLLLGGLILASATVWWWAATRRLNGAFMVGPINHAPVVWPVAVPFLVLPVSLIVQTLVAGLWMSPEHPEGDLLWQIQGDCLARALAWISLLLLPATVSPWKAANLGCRRHGLFSDIVAGGVTTLAAFGPVLAINVLLARLEWKDPEALHPLLTALQADPGRLLPWVAFSAVILAPLHEELLYRVLLQGGLESRVGTTTAIGISTFLFCGAHLAPGRPDGLALIPLALLLGWLQSRTRSYAAIVTAHSLFNLVNLGLALMPEVT